MEKLTIEHFKSVGARYSNKSHLIRNLAPSGYKQKSLSQGEQHALFIQGIITFTSDDELDRFLREELMNLTKTDLMEIFEWKKPDFKTHITSMFKLLFDAETIHFSDIEMQFLLLYSWRLFTFISIHTSKKTFSDFIKEYYNKSWVVYQQVLQMEKVKDVLETIDNFGYCTKQEIKKAIMECELNI